MKLKISKYIGLCFGISDAMDTIFKHKNIDKLYIFGDLAHNENLINKLKESNIKIVKNINEIPKNSDVIVRAHGMSKDCLNIMKKLNLNIIDKTCPKIKIIYSIINKEIKNSNIIITGYKKHPEIIGIIGQVKEYKKKITIFENFNDFNEKIKKIDKKNNFCLVSQTTFDIEEFENIKEKIKYYLPNIKTYNTICNDMLNRIEEIINESKKSDLVIIIGSDKSSNSTKLYNISKKINKNTIHIKNYNEIDINILKDKEKIFLTSSASTMLSTVNEVYNFLLKIKII